jgi:polar amino acid transport system substrate-binding protein
MQRVFSIVLISLLTAFAHADTAPWTFVTEDFPPFTYPSAHAASPAEGVVAAGPLVEILQTVCARMQRDCTIRLYPWRRALRLAERGEVHGIFTLARSPQREQLFHISRMLITSGYSVFAREDNPFVFSRPDDLKGRLVGVYGPSGTSYMLSDRLKTVRDVRMHLAADNRRLLRMLQSGRFGDAGLAVINRDVARQLIKDENITGLREAGQIGSIAYGIGMARKAISQTQFTAFEQALDSAISDGTVPAILRRHELAPGY